MWQSCFLCKRARPDIQTAIAFLCTRVKCPDEDDYKKLTRVMRYLRGTELLPLTLEADDTHVMRWWVDASFAVHPDMKGHTGGVLSMGKGAVYGTSTKQKLVTRSSTEAELVGANDVMPQILWTRYFLEAQGYHVEENILYQDNKSAMLLESNGRGSSSKRTRHINIRYFFITDRIANGELSIEHCPTGKMLSDYFTKPLQGAPFREFRDRIMNVDPVKKLTADPRSVLGNAATVNTISGIGSGLGQNLGLEGVVKNGIESGGSNSSNSRATVLNTVGSDWNLVRKKKLRWSKNVQVHRF